jgi:predicted metal-binding protein
MPNVQHIEAIVRQHGITDFKWIDPRTIVVANWVRLKCEYGCPEYGRVAACPPNTPTVEECRQFFSEYDSGLLFHFQRSAADSAERHSWAAEVNLGLSKIEREIFLAGYPKAFLLFMDSCGLCPECLPDRRACKMPALARPSPEGMAVDVFSTVRSWGYSIEVLSNPSDQMDRYSFLMVD